MTDKKFLRKQIIYRSTHRGSKEMDMLLGNFVKKNINSFNDSELSDLNKLIQIDDETLQKWYFDKNNKNIVPDNKISQMLKNFKL